MQPTIDEIKKAMLVKNPDDQFVYIDEDEIASPGLVEALVIRVREFTVKLFRIPLIKKVVFVAVMSLSALDGIQVYVPNNAERDLVVQDLRDVQQWTLNIQAREFSNRYFMLGTPGDPTPPDVTYMGPPSTIFAPITGSAVLTQNLTFKQYDPNADPS